jgi:hypothetical protein
VTKEQVANLADDIVRQLAPNSTQARSIVRSLIHNAISKAHHAAMHSREPMTIQTRSIVSGRDYRPIVVVEWGEQEAQLSPGEARDFAERVRLVADAAESDAFIFEFVTKELHVNSEGAAAVVLHNFREFREARARADYLPPEGRPNA